MTGNRIKIFLKTYLAKQILVKCSLYQCSITEIYQQMCLVFSNIVRYFGVSLSLLKTQLTVLL